MDQSIDHRSAIVVLIDGENLAPRYARRILSIAEEIGPVTAALLYGSSTVLERWQWQTCTYLLEERPNYVWKNAADENMKREAWKFFLQCQVTTFLFATNDGHFATIAASLRAFGCTVYGTGTWQAASRWISACTTFTRLF